jgi:probable HAF family extracellular repeat protein
MRIATRLIILALAISGNLAHAAKYKVTSMTLVDLGTLGGSGGDSGANDINEPGDVVGWSEDINGNERPMIHLNGQMYFLDDSNWHGSAWATSINDNRMVVGGYALNSFYHAFYYYPGIWMTEVETNGHGLGFNWVLVAHSVNNQGVIVGDGKIIDPPGLPDAPDTVGICYTDWLPMYWSSADQNPQALFCYPDPDQNNEGFTGLRPAANEINDAGYIVGTDGGKTTYAMFLKRNSQSPVGVPKPSVSPAGLFGSANSISNTGLIVGGYGYDSAGHETPSLRAFVWDGSSSSSTSLGVLPGDSKSVAEGVNDQGMVVGTSAVKINQPGAGESAFIYHADFGMLRLPSPTGSGAAIAVCEGLAINNRKSYGLVQAAGTCWTDGHSHAMRWDVHVVQVSIQTSP